MGSVSRIDKFAGASVPTSPDAPRADCETCGKPALYGPQTPLTVSAMGKDERYRPLGSRCEDCVVMEMIDASNRLSQREQLRLAYREERERRMAANSPAVCNDCRRETHEFLCVDGDERFVCQPCLYVRLRGRMLASAVRIQDSTTRCSAIVSALASARLEARTIFAMVWDS